MNVILMDKFLKQSYQPKKKCSRCKKTLNWPENFRRKGVKKANGEVQYRSECKRCSLKEWNDWKFKNPDKLKEYRRNAYLKRKDKLKNENIKEL